MFLRLKTYLGLVEREAAASALASHLRTGYREREAEAMAARAEVKRLTNVIIHLKDQDKVLPLGFGDQVWGRYVMGEDEKPKEGYQEPTAEEREAAVDEADFHADLERALSEEA